MRGPDPEIAEEQELARQAGVEMKRVLPDGHVQKYLFVLQDSTDVRIEGVTIRERAALECSPSGLPPGLDPRHPPVLRPGARGQLRRHRHRLHVQTC